MEQEPSDNILAFDTLFTTNHMQILKSLMPYADSDLQKKLAVYIKFSEWQYTLSYFRHHKSELSVCSNGRKEFDLPSVYRMIKGYCTEAEQRQIEQLISMLSTIETMKNMQEMMEFMKEFEGAAGSAGNVSSASGKSSEDADSSSMLAMLKGMLSPEQAELLEMLQHTATVS